MARALVEQLDVGHAARPITQADHRARDEGRADQPVEGVVVDDLVAEPFEDGGETLGRSADAIVELGGRAAEGDPERERDSQPAGVRTTGGLDKRLVRWARRGRSPGCAPATVSSSSAASSTVRASGPMQVRPWKASASGQVEMRPRWGLMPTRCVHAAGMRTEPPSEPTAAATRPAATAAAEPPDEPPGVWSSDHGLRVWPKALPSVIGHWPNSGDARLADDHGAGRTQPAGDLAVGLLAGEVAGAAEGRRLPCEVHVVLDRHRHPSNGACRVGGSVFRRRSASAAWARASLAADDAERVGGQLRRVDAAQRGVDELDRGDLAGGDQRRLAAQAGEGETVGLRRCGHGGHLAQKRTGTCAFKRQWSRAVRLRGAPPQRASVPARALADTRGRTSARAARNCAPTSA